MLKKRIKKGKYSNQTAFPFCVYYGKQVIVIYSISLPNYVFAHFFSKNNSDFRRLPYQQLFGERLLY